MYLSHMKPHLLKIPKEDEHSFSVRYDIVSFFYNKWHYHPELELVYIIEASGRQFIGDSIHHFKNNDLILVGSNLPHFGTVMKISREGFQIESGSHHRSFYA